MRDLRQLRGVRNTRQAVERRLDRLLTMEEQVNHGSVPSMLLICPGPASYPDPTYLCRFKGFQEARVELVHEAARLIHEEQRVETETQTLGVNRAFFVFSSVAQRVEFLKAFLAVKEDSRSIESKKEMLLRDIQPDLCPDIDDIVWANMSVPSISGRFRRFFLSIFLVLGLLLFTSPTALVSTVGSMAAFQGVESRLNSIVSQIIDATAAVSPWASKLVFTFLPSLLLVVINACLIQTVFYVCHAEKSSTTSTMERQVVRFCFLYLVFNTIVVPGLAFVSFDAFFRYFTKHLDQQVYQTLGGIFFNSSGLFYINYLIQRACVGTAVELLRPSEVFTMSWFYPRAVTSEEKEKSVRAFEFYLGVNYGMLLSIAALVLCFALVIPIMAPFGAVYFSTKLLVDKYNLQYVRPRIPGRGLVSRTVYHCAHILLGTFQWAGVLFLLLRGTKMQCVAVFMCAASTTTWSLVSYASDRWRFDIRAMLSAKDEESTPLVPLQTNLCPFEDPILSEYRVDGDSNQPIKIRSPKDFAI